MTGRRLLLRERAVGGAERVLWGRDGDSGAAVAVVVQTTRLGPAVGGCIHLMRGDSSEAVGAAIARAALVTLAAITASAPMGGGAVVILGRADEAALATAGAMIDELDGALWMVPDLGDMPHLGRAVAAHTRFNADPDPRTTAAGIVRAAADAWEDDAGTTAGLADAHVVVLGAGPLADAVVAASGADGARVERLHDGLHALPACDVLINCGARRFEPETMRAVRCRVLVGAIGGPSDDDSVWRALAARGIQSVPGSVAAGVLLRSAAATIARHRPDGGT